MRLTAVCIGVAAAGGLIHPTIVVLGIAGTLFILFFFRDPERKIVAVPGQIVAPADGKVLSIDEVEEKNFLDARSKRISIFLSIFDVHINRAPVGGTIETVKYRPGRFAFANTADASRGNESNVIGIRGEGVNVVVKQIAGAVARRIICY
ncbi:MAG: phosphatidylserine decarboxylase, partial [Candidatus Hydrogenedentota bacterium]